MGNFRSRDFSFPFPWNESSRELKVPGTKVLDRDLSFLGTNGLGYEKSVIPKTAPLYSAPL